MAIPMYTSKRKNYKGVSLLSMAGKIYVGVLVGRVHRVTDGLTDDEHGGFRSGRSRMCKSNLHCEKNG